MAARRWSFTAASLLSILGLCALWAAPPAAKLPEPKSPPAKVRSWSDSSGKFRTDAQFVELKGGKVTLAKSDRKIDIPFDQLATDDQLFILREAIPLSDASAKLLVGKVVGVTDGDTITVLDFDKITSKVRLEGIDAPESHQDFGTQAKKSLSDKAFGQFARVEWKEKDKYKRILGNVFVDDRFVNLELIEEGFAWHYKEYNKDQEFAAAEVRGRG